MVLECFVILTLYSAHSLHYVVMLYCIISYQNAVHSTVGPDIRDVD